MASGPVSIRDVARKAGVSVGTASLALNNRPYVSQQARQRVLDAVDELGYVPNLIGKALNRRKCGVIGVIVPVAVAPHFPTIVTGISERCEREGKTIFVSYSHDSAAVESRLLKMFRHLHVDGIILAAAPSRDNVGLVSSLMKEGTPIVQIERHLPGVAGDFVATDNRALAADHARRLIAKGHRRVGLVRSALDYSVNDERRAGYLDALSEAGIAPEPAWELRIDPWRRQAVTLTIEQYLRDPSTPSAILWDMGFTETMARTLTAMEKVNGRDVDITVFDADPLQDLSGQSFVNAMQDGKSIGFEAVQLLRQRIDEQTTVARKTRPPVNLRIPGVEIRLVPMIGGSGMTR